MWPEFLFVANQRQWVVYLLVLSHEVKNVATVFNSSQLASMVKSENAAAVLNSS